MIFYFEAGQEKGLGKLYRCRSLALELSKDNNIDITISTALNNGDTLDGVTLANGDRVLVKNQSTGSENGIYVVAASPARATDFDASSEVTSGLFTFVEMGTVNSDSGWVLTTDGAITLDSTAIAFTQFSGAGQITAGAGFLVGGLPAAAGAVATEMIAGSARTFTGASSMGGLQESTL